VPPTAPALCGCRQRQFEREWHACHTAVLEIQGARLATKIYSSCKQQLRWPADDDKEAVKRQRMLKDFVLSGPMCSACSNVTRQTVCSTFQCMCEQHTAQDSRGGHNGKRYAVYRTCALPRCMLRCNLKPEPIAVNSRKKLAIEHRV
jgi:hypothetical protein